MGKNNPVENTDSQKALSLEQTTSYGKMWKEVSGVCFASVKDVAAEQLQNWGVWTTKYTHSTGVLAMANGFNQADHDAYADV